MPRIKSAKKALRQNARHREKNLAKIKPMKKLIKEIGQLIVAKKKDETIKLLPKVYQAIDKSAKAGIIKKNTAARRKSRLTKLINKI